MPHFRILMCGTMIDALFFCPGTLSPFWNISLWVALGVFTALLPVLPKPWGILFFLVSLILRAIYTMGLGPALLLLGTVNVSDRKFNPVLLGDVKACFVFFNPWALFSSLSALQQISLPCKFCGQPGDVHSRLQSSCYGHALYLPFGLCHHLRPGPLCAWVFLQFSGKNSSTHFTSNILWLIYQHST